MRQFVISIVTSTVLSIPSTIQSIRLTVRSVTPQVLSTKSSPSENSELSNNLLLLVFRFEGAFYVTFCFFFAHVVTFVVIFFPFTDAD